METDSSMVRDHLMAQISKFMRHSTVSTAVHEGRMMMLGKLVDTVIAKTKAEEERHIYDTVNLSTIIKQRVQAETLFQAAQDTLAACKHTWPAGSPCGRCIDAAAHLQSQAEKHKAAMRAAC